MWQGDDAFVRDVTIMARGDETPFFAIVDLAIGKYAAGEDLEVVRDRSLGVVDRLLELGLVDVGRMDDAGAFVPQSPQWPRMRDEVRRCYDGDRGGDWAFTFWVVNTALGERMARRAPDGYVPLDRASEEEQ